MNFDNDDALDRALFALPLEEPPADLRASILTATIYRPAPVFSFREHVALAAVCAVVVSLFVHSLQALGAATLRGLSNTSLVLWAAAGGATAIWLSIFTGFQPRTEGKAARRR
jgi:hypothetical protein